MKEKERVVPLLYGVLFYQTLCCVYKAAIMLNKNFLFPGFINSETETLVKASAPHGKINLKVQDWLSSIKLKF